MKNASRNQYQEWIYFYRRHKILVYGMMVIVSGTHTFFEAHEKLFRMLYVCASVSLLRPYFLKHIFFLLPCNKIANYDLMVLLKESEPIYKLSSSFLAYVQVSAGRLFFMCIHTHRHHFIGFEFSTRMICNILCVQPLKSYKLKEEIRPSHNFESFQEQRTCNRTTQNCNRFAYEINMLAWSLELFNRTTLRPARCLTKWVW